MKFLFAIIAVLFAGVSYAGGYGNQGVPIQAFADCVHQQPVQFVQPQHQVQQQQSVYYQQPAPIVIRQRQSRHVPQQQVVYQYNAPQQVVFPQQQHQHRQQQPVFQVVQPQRQRFGLGGGGDFVSDAGRFLLFRRLFD